MFLCRAVVAPCPDTNLWYETRQLRRCLRLDVLLKIGPVALLSSEQGVSRSGTKVADNYTAKAQTSTMASFPTGIDYLPQEKGKDDDTTKKVEQDKEYRIPLRKIGLWLNIPSNDIHRRRHDIDPAFKGNNLEQNQDRFFKRVECPFTPDKRRICPYSWNEKSE